MTNKNPWMHTRKLTRETLYEHMQYFMPLDQQPYCTQKAYIAICDAFWDYLQSDVDTKQEKRQIVEHAREVFDHFCSTETNPELYTWSNDLQKAIQ